MLYLTGIHDARQLAGFDPTSWTGVRRRIAIDLIDEIDRQGDPAVRVALFERIVDVRGAFKRTYPDRFADFDAMLLEAWRAHGPTQRPDPRRVADFRGASKQRRVHVLDAAVSDGSTALPLLAAFAKLTDGELRYTATDLDGRYIKLWRAAEPRRRVILSEGGQIVQIIAPPFLFTHRESRHLFPLNRLLRPLAERFASALIADWKRGDAAVRSSEILLFNPDFRRLVENDPRVAFRAWDILEPWAGDKADCVRAMNVLNAGYFDADQMRRVVANLFDALADGGLLAIGSNEMAGSAVDGVICRRTGDKLAILAKSGQGFRASAVLADLLIPPE